MASKYLISKYIFFSSLQLFLITILIFFINNAPIIAQGATITYENITLNGNIKTVLIYKEGSYLSSPVIEMNSNDKIKLCFDDLSGDVKDYSYTVIHCTSDWHPTNLSKNEYLDGFTDDHIKDYQFSFNTYFNFIHYNVTLPNENINLKLSGNYIIKVFEDYDEEKVVLIKRFCVYEPKVTIDATVKKPFLSEFLDSGQEIDFNINHKYYPINNPHNEIKVIITQNDDWNKAITNLKPLFISSNELNYDYSEENIFDGGNEFRYFDIASTRYQSRYVQNITFNKYFHILLFPEKSKQDAPYFSESDVNGKYQVNVQEGRNAEMDADYVYVYFTLEAEYPYANGNIYVYGGLSNWECKKENRMVYNEEYKQYELTLLLKQGYYNYQYAYVRDNALIINTKVLEGSHYETENDYAIYVYHIDYKSRYEKLIGVKFLNSTKK